ncbi:TPA: creatininase family protein [Thermoplasmata archaeon]|nr:creatininase family protein [Thermoplasmata archaeon]
MSERSARKTRSIDEMTSPEFAREVKRDPLVILPFGSVEEHGSHLPLGTDSMQCEEVVRRIAERFDALVLPPIRYGECRTTRNFPGTITLRSETVQSLAFDIVSELARHGVKKVLVLSGHAGSGHMAAIRLGVQRAVEVSPAVKAMVLSDYDIAYDLAGKEFPRDDGHAGQIETSRMLGIRPDLVGRSRPVGRTRPPKYMILPEPEKFIPTGVMGDSRGSSAEKGGRIDEYIVDNLSEVVARNFGVKPGVGKARGRASRE